MYIGVPDQKIVLLSLLIPALYGQQRSAFERASLVAPFRPAPAGCAMVHCDVRMSDIVRLVPPLSSSVVVRAHDTLAAGSGNPSIPWFAANQGNGCAANGSIAVCSYNNTFGDNVVAYRADGSRLWTSGNLLNSSAFASVPMIDATGGVIAADNRSVLRFGPAGEVVWNAPIPGGTPISPVLTQSGAIVLATRAGPISAFDSVDGRLIGSTYVLQSPGGTGFFDAMNTPCVVGNRVYISTALRNDPAHTAWLVALEIDADNPVEPLRIVWHFTFGGPSGASPLCIGDTIYFDGGRLNPGDPDSPQMLAVRDDGTTGTLVWAQAAPRPVPSSFALDPRGGFWVIFYRYPFLERRTRQTGAILESLDIPSLVGDPKQNLAHSVLTISGTATRPVLTLGTLDGSGTSSYVIAVDLVARRRLWKINITPTFGIDNIAGQFPIVMDTSGKPVVVFSGRKSGAYFVSEP